MDFLDSINTTKDGTYLFSLGQAGYILKSKSGSLLAIDPYLSDCVERLEGHMGFKRLLPKLLAPSDLSIDVIIASHEHWDHFDVDGMPGLMENNKSKLFASLLCADLVKKCNIDISRVTYVSPGDYFIESGFEMHFVNCDHGKGAPDAVGIVIKVDGKVIYEAGDTCFNTEIIDEVRGFGHIDVLIAPINGMYGNMNEEECAMLSRAINPGITIPCHYGMFASHGGDPGKFLEIMNNEYCDNKVLIMAQGETYRL